MRSVGLDFTCLCLVTSYIKTDAAQLTLKEVAYDSGDIGIVHKTSQYSLNVLFSPMVSFPIISIKVVV